MPSFSLSTAILQGGGGRAGAGRVQGGRQQVSPGNCVAALPLAKAHIPCSGSSSSSRTRSHPPSRPQPPAPHSLVVAVHLDETVLLHVVHASVLVLAAALQQGGGTEVVG